MADFHYQPMFERGPDETGYRLLTKDHVEVQAVGDREVLRVAPEALRVLAAEEIRDVSHLFRASHLQQLRDIFDDPGASDNDRFVAMEMLKNACVSAGMVLPSCQDTGTAIVLGHKGEDVQTALQSFSEQGALTL